MRYPEEQKRFDAAVKSFEGKKVAILGHVRPDGDCVGSQVALCRVLRSRNVDAFCVNNDPVPRVLTTFVGDTPFIEASEWDGSADALASVDCAALKRFGSGVSPHAEKIALNIDHHLSNPGYAVENIIIGTAAATGEILANLFLDGGYEVDPITAQACYIGIATDTGQFRFSATTEAVFDVCRRLTELGADPAKAAFELYENETYGKLQLLQRFLASFKEEFGGRVVVGLIHESDYVETGTNPEDTEGLVDYARAIEGVDLGVLLEENQGKLKGSLRAKDPEYRVDQIAKQFSGGGHAAAAGLNQDTSIEAFYPLLIKAIGAHLESIGKA
ncbi:MAG: DHH family phosphoesterase [Verrucomicrobiota bacterium]